MARTTSTHQVQFYAEHDSLSANVASFLGAPLLRGEAGVVVATPEHRAAFAAHLEAAGVDLTVVRDEGRYVELDAVETLACLMTGDQLDPVRFASLAAEVTADLEGRFGAVSAYGEMVGLLVADGRTAAARELEALWRPVLDRAALRMLCGLPREPFADPDAGGELHGIGAGHDLVAPTIACTAAVDLPPGPEAGAVARRAVTDVCSSWGLDSTDWTDDAVLVTAELVGNAVRHTGSRTAMSLDAFDGSVTVSVLDGSPDLPQPRAGARFAEDGRGFVIIDALADRWGVEPRPVGKRVWARLRPCVVPAWP